MSREYVNAVQAVWEHMARAAAEHTSALQQRRRQLVTTDAYGLEVTNSWEREKRYFIEKVLLPSERTELLFKQMLELSTKTAKEELDWLFYSAGEQVEAASKPSAQSLDDGTTSSPQTTPRDFEELCAQRLRAAGWEVRRKGGTGDQGVDLVATAHGFTFVLQCKMYASSVGNAAVQEVYSGMRHEGADWAAVVTNAAYTQAAKELSETTGVLLLHIGELTELSFDTMLERHYRKPQ